MIKAYFLPTALAISLGVNATLISGGLTSASASEVEKGYNIHKELPDTVDATFKSFLDSKVCLIPNSDLGENVCDQSVFKRVCFDRDDESGKFVINANIPIIYNAVVKPLP